MPSKWRKMMTHNSNLPVLISLPATVTCEMHQLVSRGIPSQKRSWCHKFLILGHLSLFLHWILKTPQQNFLGVRWASIWHLWAQKFSYIGCIDGYTSYFWELDLHSISPKTNSRSNSYRQFHTTCRGIVPAIRSMLPFHHAGGSHTDRVHPKWMDGGGGGWMDLWMCAWMDEPLASFSSISTAAW